MPLYGYCCPECGSFKSINTIAGRHMTECPECGQPSPRDVVFEFADCEGPQVITDHLRWSISMGVPASQVQEFRKRFPDSVYSDDGRLLIKNRKHKLEEAKRRGFVELD